jgi:hypothetical protein
MGGVVIESLTSKGSSVRRIAHFVIDMQSAIIKMGEKEEKWRS